MPFDFTCQSDASPKPDKSTDRRAERLTLPSLRRRLLATIPNLEPLDWEELIEK